MSSKRALLEVDPLCLPLGMRVGSWRIQGWRGRGSYGTLYRVEHVKREVAGPFALKLAISPGDERFEREAWLLSRIHSLHVPRLYEHGVWAHPSGTFPYLVMEWVDGVPLYEWSGRRNLSSRQALRASAQVARALEATHAVGGVHRDVKGENVLVRPADGRVFLTDFGAGHYRGAATLTSKLLPPGTPAYRSPEAWGFLEVFRRHPTVHYPATPCDDLFALGVMAYRLVTDEYPPLTHPSEKGAEVWREGGHGPRPSRELNPRVSPELDARIMRLLSVAPVERFEGSARKAAEALEQAAESAGPAADEPLFTWGRGWHRPRWRDPGMVRLVAEGDAAARAEFEQSAREGQAPAQSRLEPMSRPRTRPPGWATELVVAFVGLWLAGLIVALFHDEPKQARSAAGKESREGDIVSVGDHAIGAPISTQESVPLEDGRRAVGRPLPERPLDGQRRPPCNRLGEVSISGGCWYRVPDILPPCKEEGKEDGYAWKGACYTPSYPPQPQRQPTSDPP
ncbi:MAG: serine/threonine-protein kinase [Hyalangium sp.]|uniref:serine/threonine-protein kinase n=1 Tax=Hyalangium sp. TaxID=2028555 RepID=UPI003899B5BD